MNASTSRNKRIFAALTLLAMTGVAVFLGLYNDISQIIGGVLISYYGVGAIIFHSVVRDKDSFYYIHWTGWYLLVNWSLRVFYVTLTAKEGDSSEG